MNDPRHTPEPGENGPFLGFQHLMPYRVQDILLVSSLYDSFTLQEDGQLNELIVSEALELHLHHTPGITHVSSGAEALLLARKESRFNLILTTVNPGDMNASRLAREVKTAGLDVPVVLLAYDHRELSRFMSRQDTSYIDRCFLWQGSPRILMAIVNSIEDLRNVEHDTRTTGVRVILLVEDDVRYYSSFLPVIYAELIRQSERLMSEGMNLAHKLVRMRARPKILLCTSFEEAWERFTAFRDHMLGVISDVEFRKDREASSHAGLELARMIRSVSPDLPILLQSGQPELEARAASEGAAFLRKGSPTLLHDLRHFMVENFAFGDFVFRLPDGRETDRASDLRSLEEKLLTVPAESIAYHAERNHFSNWLTARTEFALARKLRPRKVSDFSTFEHLRRNLADSLLEYRHEQAELLVGDFDRHNFDPSAPFFTRIGSGSLGGKARGLAFVRRLLGLHELNHNFRGVHLGVPPSVVLATDVFDRFLSENDLLDWAINAADDEEIQRRFSAARLPQDVVSHLEAFLAAVHWPLAVRSSSLLEDSQYQPFTGVYDTFMLANRDPDLSTRVEQLVRAVKRVYASTFSRRAKGYLRATPYRLEEEKMAVIVQRVVGGPHGPRFYPDLSGVARSHNFYPVAPATSEDGVAAVALGMGRTVVEGEKCLTFCPRYPKNLLQFSSVEDILANSQRQFWALGLERSSAVSSSQAMRETLFDLETAETDGTLFALGSTYSQENRAVYDGLSRPGVRLVSFASVLKHGMFPLAQILTRLLEFGRQGMNCPIEIEFAAQLTASSDQIHDFGVLQMRPMVPSQEAEELEVEEVDPALLLCKSQRVLGHGKLDHLRDAIVVDFHRFDRALSREAAQAVARFNAELSERGAPYLLIGVGRWGSADPWLGIPVTWDQISGAKVIVEAGFRDIRITPSQGSHFFQNLTSFQAGYFTVNPELGEGFVDWEWLATQPAVAHDSHVRLLHFARPLLVKMNGRTNQGVIRKPEA
ncbi:MAG: PEP/pyruvate-binding domain-containing protein [Pseudomonadota bacterium]